MLLDLDALLPGRARETFGAPLDDVILRKDAEEMPLINFVTCAYHIELSGSEAKPVQHVRRRRVLSIL